MAEPASTPTTDFQPRAFELLSRLPAGCFLFRQPDDWTEPHIRAGERVVVDPNDREIEWGGIYLLQHSRRRAIWQVRPEHETLRRPGPECAMCHPLRPNTRADEEAFRAGRPVRLRMSDGPIYLAALERKIVGRVVGVFAPASPSAEVGRPAGALAGLTDRLRDLDDLARDTLEHAETQGFHGTAERTRALLEAAKDRLATAEPSTPAELVELLGALAWLIGDDGSPQAVLARRLHTAAATLLGEGARHG